jgi:hypothetical protein
MPPVSAFHLVFLAYNLALGLAVGTSEARSTTFAALGIPTFLWLVAGLFVFEVVAGLVMNKHPAVLLSMPWRIGGLSASLVAFYLTLGALTAS